MSKFKKSYILIVDDNPANILTLEAVLKPLNQYLVRAYSGKEALKKVLKYDFSVILMDAHMPELNGFETVKLIRLREKSRYTPVIFLSAYHQDELDIAQGYEIGAVDYITKPVNPYILYSKVQVFVDLFTKSIHAQALRIELKKRLRVEKELKKLAERTQVILESAVEGVYELNAKGIITFANSAAAQILGREIHELIGYSLQVMLISAEKEANEQGDWKKTSLFLALKNNAVYHNDDGTFFKKNGDEIPVEYTISPKQQKRSRGHAGAVVMFKDISSRKRAEELVLQHQHQLELAHKAQLSALEEMASTLAHELNQPLASIANYTRGCIRRVQAKSFNTDEFVCVLEEVAGLAERAGKIIHRVKDLSRKDKLYCERIHINDLILGMDNLINYEKKDSDVHIQFKLLDASLYVMADKIQLEQVILNLLRNGIEAMYQMDGSEKKQLIIQTDLIDEKNTSLVVLNIIDAGPGFLPGITDKLLDLYFTTKHQGMGMGLSICRTIIETHGGNISVKDNPSGGAWIQVTLPLEREK